MRVLVTGGAGFIGSHVAEACLADGHEVLVLDDLSSGSRANVPRGAALVELDLCDGDGVARVLRDFRPDVVSHHAAQVSVSASVREPPRDARINIGGTIHLLQACVENGVQRVVFASTGGAIYGELPTPERGRVGRPPAPLSPYACSKLAAEIYLDYYRRAHGLQGTALRYANVYGPRQDPHGEAGVVAIFCERLLAGKPIRIHARRTPGDEGCIRDYVYVADVVRANRMALGGELSEPCVNVGTGVETTTLALARRIEAAVGVEACIEFTPRRPGDVERSVLEPWPALGSMVSLEQGIAKTVEWFRARH